MENDEQPKRKPRPMTAAGVGAKRKMMEPTQ